jgi:hypothetical protein
LTGDRSFEEWICKYDEKEKKCVEKEKKLMGYERQDEVRDNVIWGFANNRIE